MYETSSRLRCVGQRLPACFQASRRVNGSVAIVVVVMLGSLAAADISRAAFVQIDPKTTYLRSDTPEGAVPILLSALGMQPGDTISLQQIGDFTPDLAGGTPDANQDLLAVFSSSSTLLSNVTFNRVPGALQTGLPVFVTDATYYGQENTDIPEDFKVLTAGLTVQIPANAVCIFTAPYDVYYGDNADPNNNYGLSISSVPEPTSFAAAAIVACALGVRRRPYGHRV